MQTLASDGRLYVHAFSLSLVPMIEISRLRAAWIRAAELISIFRTSFRFVPELDTWCQIVHSIPHLNWSEVSYDSSAQYQGLLRDFLSAKQWGSEDVFKQPPLRLLLLRSKENGEDTLVLLLHHALYDGLSISKLFDVVRDLYYQRPIAPIEPFSSLLPYLCQQEQHGTTFWTSKLRGVCAPTLVSTIHDVAEVAVHTVTRSVRVSTEKVNTLIAEGSVTLQCVGQAALAKLLFYLTGSNDIVFGRVVAGRNLPHSEDAVGPMMVSNIFLNSS